ncbi:MAG: thioredoxin family protein [Patescibacteria group bacterium]
MKNPIVIFAIIAVVAVLGFGAYTLSQKSSQSDSIMKKDDGAMKSDPTTITGQGEMMDDNTDNSRYAQYSKSALDSAANTRRVLFFYASWCPTCKPADANFTQNVSKIPEDVTLVRVNYNDPETDQEEKDLAKKYGITYQHTFVQIDSAGKEVAKWNGGQIEELLSNIK